MKSTAIDRSEQHGSKPVLLLRVEAGFHRFADEPDLARLPLNAPTIERLLRAMRDVQEMQRGNPDFESMRFRDDTLTWMCVPDRLAEIPPDEEAFSRHSFQRRLLGLLEGKESSFDWPDAGDSDLRVTPVVGDRLEVFAGYARWTAERNFESNEEARFRTVQVGYSYLIDRWQDMVLLAHGDEARRRFDFLMDLSVRDAAILLRDSSGSSPRFVSPGALARLMQSTSSWVRTAAIQAAGRRDVGDLN